MGRRGEPQGAPRLPGPSRTCCVLASHLTRNRDATGAGEARPRFYPAAPRFPLKGFMSLAVGTRVQPHEAIGTIEKIRPAQEGYLVGEVVWDSGARSAEPLSWLISLEDREAEREAARLEALELRRLEREQLRKEPERECDGCPERFKPTRKGQRFHSKSCRNRAKRLSL
jgi:hypothetical protein